MQEPKIFTEVKCGTTALPSKTQCTLIHEVEMEKEGREKEVKGWDKERKGGREGRRRKQCAMDFGKSFLLHFRYQPVSCSDDI